MQRLRPAATVQDAPYLPRHVRLHYDTVRHAWALLSPEKVMWPDDASLAILRLCDGKRNIEAIAGELAREFGADQVEVEGDVLAFVRDWSDRMVLRL